MRAKIKSSGEIVDVVKNGYMYIGEEGVTYSPAELEVSEGPSVEDWMKHQGPVMFVDYKKEATFSIAKHVLQGLVTNPSYSSQSKEFLVDRSIEIAEIMVERYNRYGNDKE